MKDYLLKRKNIDFLLLTILYVFSNLWLFLHFKLDLEITIPAFLIYFIVQRNALSVEALKNPKELKIYKNIKIYRKDQNYNYYEKWLIFICFPLIWLFFFNNDNWQLLMVADLFFLYFSVKNYEYIRNNAVENEVVS